MSLGKIVSAQIADYPRVHRSRNNLKIHIMAVPMFWAGFIALAIGAATLTLSAALIGALLLLLSAALQGWGHKIEAEPPAPFASPFEGVIRLTTENLYVFPRYVLSGGWGRAWREAAK
jgi:hypothetical protein